MPLLLCDEERPRSSEGNNKNLPSQEFLRFPIVYLTEVVVAMVARRLLQLLPTGKTVTGKLNKSVLFIGGFSQEQNNRGMLKAVPI